MNAGGWPLPGTLVTPVGDGPFPAVVLVHGSGANDRDASFGPNKVFRDLAEGLVSRGVAVLRYDKRTLVHGPRLAKSQTFTVKDEVVDDAVAAVKLLRETRGIRADRIFVLGHSLGGMIAPRIGAADSGIAGLIVMAGAVRSLDRSIVDQGRYLAELDGKITPEEQKQLDANAKFAVEVRALQPSSPPVTAPGFGAPASYFLDLRGYSPPDAARRLTQRMLILGTFAWQMQPYCNRLLVTVVQAGANYTLDGFDDQCGAPQRATITGSATLNPEGTIGVGFNIVLSPNGAPVHVSARLSPTTVSGVWQDSTGQTGTLAFGAASGGAPRPAAAGTALAALTVAGNGQVAGTVTAGGVAANTAAFGALTTTGAVTVGDGLTANQVTIAGGSVVGPRLQVSGDQPQRRNQHDSHGSRQRPAAAGDGARECGRREVVRHRQHHDVV